MVANRTAPLMNSSDLTMMPILQQSGITISIGEMDAGADAESGKGCMVRELSRPRLGLRGVLAGAHVL